MANFGISYITKVIYSILTLLLLIIIYSYLISLENKGCKCAISSNINFIKNFTIFAIIYLLFTAIIPDEVILDNFGTSVAMIHKFIDLIFNLVFIYYLYEVFMYTRALVNEKCKCSIDSRREIIMIGTIIEFLLIFVLFLVHIIFVVILSTFFNVVKTVQEGSGDLKEAIHDPIGSMSKVPSRIKTEFDNINNYMNKTSDELSKISRVNSRVNSRVSSRVNSQVNLSDRVNSQVNMNNRVKTGFL